MEATVRVSFESPAPLTFNAINELHAKLRGDFPQITEPQNVQIPPGIGKPTIEFGPGQIPGVVYTGNRQGIQIALQSQLLYVGWVKQLATDGPEYPRFPALRDTLWHAVDAYHAVSTGVPIIVVNMSYLNFIRVTGDGVLPKYFSKLVQVAATQNARQLHKLEVSWQEQNLVDLRFNLEHVRLNIGAETVDGYSLTTAAGLQVAAPSEPRDALEDVHDRLQVFFSELISNHAKSEWKLSEPVDA